MVCNASSQPDEVCRCQAKKIILLMRTRRKSGWDPTSRRREGKTSELGRRRARHGSTLLLDWQLRGDTLPPSLAALARLSLLLSCLCTLYDLGSLRPRFCEWGRPDGDIRQSATCTSSLAPNETYYTLRSMSATNKTRPTLLYLLQHLVGIR